MPADPTSKVHEDLYTKCYYYGRCETMIPRHQRYIRDGMCDECIERVYNEFEKEQEKKTAKRRLSYSETQPTTKKRRSSISDLNSDSSDGCSSMPSLETDSECSDNDS